MRPADQADEYLAGDSEAAGASMDAVEEGHRHFIVQPAACAPSCNATAVPPRDS